MLYQTFTKWNGARDLIFILKISDLKIKKIMNKIFKISVFAMAMMLLNNIANAQCKADECISKLGVGYTFLKTYQLEKIGDEMEHSYVFSKETNYMLVLCNKDGAAKNVEVSLFDSSRKLIASNYDKKNDKYYPAIAYNCKATGMYYLRFHFNSKSECCVSVLAFKR